VEAQAPGAGAGASATSTPPPYAKLYATAGEARRDTSLVRGPLSLSQAFIT